MTVRTTKNRVPELLRAMNALASKEVLVGIPSDGADNERADAPITNAQIGFINEFGAPEMNIPARPFLIPGVQKAWPEAQKRMTAGAKALLRFAPNASTVVDSALEGAGLLAQGEVVQMINDGLEPKLSDATLYARAQKGFAGTSPLIVTGSLKQSITYVVQDAGPQ